MNKRVFLILLFILLFVAQVGLCASKWNERRGTHFIIYYKDAPEDFIKSVEEAAEDYYYNVTQDLGFYRTKLWSWDNRAKIYIYRDQEDYIQSARQAKWSSGSASVAKKEIRTYPTMYGFFDSVLPHELGHIIFREFIGFSTKIPLWLDEGVAIYQEKARRWGVNSLVRQAIAQKKFIPLKELSKIRLYRTTPKETVDLFYSEAASVVYYLISELGQYRFVKFCRELRRRKTFEQALNAAYSRFHSIDDLNNQWLDYLNH